MHTPIPLDARSIIASAPGLDEIGITDILGDQGKNPLGQGLLKC